MTAADRKLLESFRKALAENQLRLVYQPKVSLRDGTLGRVEALVRWDDPELGSVSPPASYRSPKSMASLTS
ncbi:EAL domain-containing protein [Sphingomonas daechungensis]|uniref:EAL domain-containing protein n=1 Tax=Sphingomonas daechungensis TaxID=1176646 RepID=A0ABX6SYZ3_9SPHN|nr:EAL domain-containing protein [Sphingomonas daechungensis]QNP42817.1 EAL domain-containing protein [Sphingomonas daechungensis]